MGGTVTAAVPLLPKPQKSGRKPKRAIRRTAPPRKARKTTLAGLKRRLWTLLASAVKRRDGNVCFSCGQTGLAGHNWQAGHLFSAGAHSALRYDAVNIHVQCYRCNIHLGGNGAAYAARFISRYGLGAFELLAQRSRVMKAWRAPELLELIAALEAGDLAGGGA